MTSRMSEDFQDAETGDGPEPEPDQDEGEVQREFETCCEIIQSKKSPLEEKTKAVLEGWARLRDLFAQKRARNFPVIFDRLYLATAKLILGGDWYKAITDNNYKNGDVLKNGLLKSLNAVITEVSLEYPMECKCCLNLKPLLDRSPWSLTYIMSIINPNGEEDSSAVEELWKEENESLLDVRLELLCTAKKYKEAFSLAQACYQEKEKNQASFEDQIKNSLGSTRKEQLERRKIFNEELTNFFYLLLCRNKFPSDIEKFLSVPTAVEVVSHLSDISPNRKRLASKWKEWKKACKTIISTTADFFIKQQLDDTDVDVDLTKRVFSYWIKHAAKDEEEIRPAKDLLDQIDHISTELIYVFADVLYDNFKARNNSVQKTIELYFRAMSKDINQIEKVDVTYNQTEKKQLLKNKLASRYLRLAKLFACDRIVSWELTLTAFSLSPAEDLFKELFSQQPIEKTALDSSVFELSPALKEDLQTVIANPRWKSLCWVKDKTELEKLCRQQLDTGGPKIKAKEDLIHLHIDYEKYEPRQETIDENDFGFEKGYEPKNFEAFGAPRRKKRGRGKSILMKKAIPRRKPFPTAFNKQGKKKIFGVNQSGSINQLSKISVGSMGIAKTLSDNKQMKIIQRQSQPFSRESLQNMQSNIMLKKRFGRKKPVFSHLYQHKYVLNLDSQLKHIQFPRCLTKNDEYGEDLGPSTSFPRFTGSQACAGNELEYVNMNTLNANDFNEKNLLGLVAVVKEFEGSETIQTQANEAVCSEHLAKLISAKYLDSFKLEPTLFSKSLEPIVTLENLIPNDFVQSSATNLAFNYIIQVMNKSLDAFRAACQNPALSETLKAAMEIPADDPIPDPDSTIPQIISEACQYSGMHSSLNGLGGTSSVYRLSSQNKLPIRKEVGPKRTTNRRYAKRIIKQASTALNQDIALKQQALGLEFKYGNLVRASTLSIPASVNPDSENSGDSKDLHVQPSDMSMPKFQFHRFEDFIIAQAEVFERSMNVRVDALHGFDQPQGVSNAEVICGSQSPTPLCKDASDADRPTVDVLTKQEHPTEPVGPSNEAISEAPFNQDHIEASHCDEQEKEQGTAISAEQVRCPEQGRASVPLVCSIVKLIYGDYVRNKSSQYLPKIVETCQQSHPKESLVQPENDLSDLGEDLKEAKKCIKVAEEDLKKTEEVPDEPKDLKRPEDDPNAPEEDFQEPEDLNILEKNDANDPDYTPFASPASTVSSKSPTPPLSPTPMSSKRKSSVSGKSKPKPKRFKNGMNGELGIRPKARNRRESKSTDDLASVRTVTPSIPLPPIAFPVVLPPPREIRIDSDALTNHGNYTDGSNFLDEKTGYFDVINESMDLNFPSPESSEQPWDDTFGLCSDSEETQNNSWLADWKRNNPEESRVVENEADGQAEEEPVISKDTFESVTEKAATSDVTIISELKPVECNESRNGSCPEYSETDLSKGHTLKKCVVRVKKLSLRTGDLIDSATVKHSSEAESCSSVVSNSVRSNSSKSVKSGSDSFTGRNNPHQGGRRSKRNKDDFSSSGQRRKDVKTSFLQSKSRSKSKQSSSEDEYEPPVRSSPTKSRGKPRSGTKTKRNTRKGGKRRVVSSDDSEDSDTSVQTIMLDDSDSERDENQSEDLEELDKREALEGPLAASRMGSLLHTDAKDYAEESPADKQKAERSWQKFAITGPEDEVIDVPSDKDDEVDPLDVSHVVADEVEDFAEITPLIHDLSDSKNEGEEFKGSFMRQRDYRKLSEDSNSATSDTGKSYIIVKKVDNNPVESPGGDTSAGELMVCVEGPETGSMVFVSEERSLCENIQEDDEVLNNEDDFLKLVTNNDEDILSHGEPEIVLLEELGGEADSDNYSPEQDIFSEEQALLGDVQESGDSGSGNPIACSTEVGPQHDEIEDEILNERDICIEPEEIVREDSRNCTYGRNASDDHDNLQIAENSSLIVNEASVLPTQKYGATFGDAQKESEMDVPQVSPENNDRCLMDDDGADRASEGTTEAGTDYEEQQDFLPEICTATFEDTQNQNTEVGPEDGSCTRPEDSCLNSAAQTSTKPLTPMDCSKSIQQDLPVTPACMDDDNDGSDYNLLHQNLEISQLVLPPEQQAESATPARMPSFIAEPLIHEQRQSVNAGENVGGNEIVDGCGRLSAREESEEGGTKLNFVIGNPHEMNFPKLNEDSREKETAQVLDSLEEQVGSNVKGLETEQTWESTPYSEPKELNVADPTGLPAASGNDSSDELESRIAASGPTEMTVEWEGTNSDSVDNCTSISIGCSKLAPIEKSELGTNENSESPAVVIAESDFNEKSELSSTTKSELASARNSESATTENPDLAEADKYDPAVVVITESCSKENCELASARNSESAPTESSELAAADNSQSETVLVTESGSEENSELASARNSESAPTESSELAAVDNSQSDTVVITESGSKVNSDLASSRNLESITTENSELIATGGTKFDSVDNTGPTAAFNLCSASSYSLELVPVSEASVYEYDEKSPNETERLITVSNEAVPENSGNLEPPSGQFGKSDVNNPFLSRDTNITGHGESVEVVAAAGCSRETSKPTPTRKRRRRKASFNNSKKSKKFQSCEPAKEVSAIVCEELRATQSSPDVNPSSNQFGFENSVKSKRMSKNPLETTGVSDLEITSKFHPGVLGNEMDDDALKKNLSNCDSSCPPVDISSGDNREGNEESIINEDDTKVSEEALLDDTKLGGKSTHISFSQNNANDKEDLNFCNSSGGVFQSFGNSSSLLEGRKEQNFNFMTDLKEIPLESNPDHDQKSTRDEPSESLAPISDPYVASIPTCFQMNEDKPITGADNVALSPGTSQGISNSDVVEDVVVLTNTNGDIIQYEDSLSFPTGNHEDSASMEITPSRSTASAQTSSNIVTDGKRVRRRRRHQTGYHGSKGGERKSKRVALSRKRKEEESNKLDEDVLIIKEVPVKLMPAVPKEEVLPDLDSDTDSAVFRGEFLSLKTSKNRTEPKTYSRKNRVFNSSRSPDEEVTRILEPKNGFDSEKQTKKRKTKGKFKQVKAPFSYSEADLPTVTASESVPPRDVSYTEPFTPGSIVTESSEASQRTGTPCNEKMPDIAMERYSALSFSVQTLVTPSLPADNCVSSKSYGLRRRKIRGTTSTEDQDSDREEKFGNGIAPVLSPAVPQTQSSKEYPSAIIPEDRKLALSPEITDVVSASKRKANKRTKKFRTVNNPVDTQSCKRVKKEQIELLDFDQSESPPILTIPEDNATLFPYGDRENCRSPPILVPEV